jgi:hypothetical protein
MYRCPAITYLEKIFKKIKSSSGWLLGTERGLFVNGEFKNKDR